VRNLELVKRIANRIDIKKRVINYYHSMTNPAA